MTETRILELFIAPERQGTYFYLPFQVPADTERLTLRYRYERFRESAAGGFTSREEVNTIDLGLLAPDGTQAGASGANKREITISASDATPGYKAMELVPGDWRILVGAYLVAPEGVQVIYELTFTPKHWRWLKGDLHTHTLASDGVLTVEELGRHAVRHGLDFIAVTDHNQFSTRAGLPQIGGLTLIPGVEWTHFRGHANFLGADQPYDGPYPLDTFQDVLERFNGARERGALITLNHPREKPFAFEYDYTRLPWDCWEVWNGPMRP
ncbi:MAG: CehA/McbA family metallohydrolase, partial [Anaerolineae bacterium]